MTPGASFWTPLDPKLRQNAALGRPMGPQRALLGPLWEHLIFNAFFNGFWLAPRVPQGEIGGRAAYPLGAWENAIF